MNQCPKCGCEIDDMADACPGCLESVNSLLAAIEGDYHGMSKPDLILTCNMLLRGREAWKQEAEMLTRKLLSPGCLFAGPGRGDCEHFIGLPSLPIEGKHDGSPTEDEFGKPNGWCWHCWWAYRTAQAEQKARNR